MDGPETYSSRQPTCIRYRFKTPNHTALTGMLLHVGDPATGPAAGQKGRGFLIAPG